MEHDCDDCCGKHVIGPKQNERRILLDNIIFIIHGEGQEMYCTFEDQISGRKDVCPDPPQEIVDHMNKLKGQ